MSDFNKDDYFYLGCIKKTHGLKGNLVFFLDVNQPSEYLEMESVFIEINKQLVPFFINSLSIYKKNLARVEIEDIDTLEQAETFVGRNLYLPAEVLPELDSKKFYYHEVVGFTVIDKTHGEIGVIDNILEYPTQDIISIKKDYKEILIPINDDFIVEVNREEKIFKVDTPEGLIDLYLE